MGIIIIKSVIIIVFMAFRLKPSGYPLKHIRLTSGFVSYSLLSQ